jgi:hypothetical protein
VSKPKLRRHTSLGAGPSPDAYEVGYGRPPKKTQFKPGQSGNPRGRPRGAKGEDTIFRQVINTKVPMGVRGKVRQVPLLEAVWMRIAGDALKGNSKAATLLLNRSRLLEAATFTGPELDQDDQQVLQSYYRQVQAELKAKKEKSR